MTDKADELLDLARQRFPKLTQAETKLFKAVADGQFANYQVGDKKKDDPTQGDKWGKLRTLRADRIAWLCTDDHACRFVGHKGIQIIGAKIEGELDLLFTRLAFPITLFSCRVLEPMDFSHGKVRGLFFDGSHIAGLGANGLMADGDINLRNGFYTEGEVNLLRATIGGDLNCTSGHFRNPQGCALSADGLKIEGSLYLRYGFRAEGEVRLLGASIGGQFSCIAGRFQNPEGKALSADCLKVEGSVHLQDGFHSEGEVRLLGASIDGNLNCSKGRFQNPEGVALNADGLKVEGAVNLRDDFRAEGEVRLLGASIGGNLDCSGGRFQNPDAIALSADGLRIEGYIVLRDGFHSEGETRLLGASIGGDLDCSKGLFHNPKGNALNADGLKAEGSVNLGHGFHSKGEVRLLGSSIGSDLDCSGGWFAKPKGDALCLEGARINGNIFMRADQDKAGREVKPVVRGRIDLIRTEVKGGFHWSDLEVSEETMLDLRHAHIGVLFDEPGSWLPSGNLFLDGCTYDRIEGLQPGDAKPRVEWIKCSQPGSFTPQPYEQLAKVFRENGFEEDARDVLIAKNDSYIKYAFVSRWAKIRRRIFGWVLGYGYRPWKAVWWLLGFWGIGTGLFWLGRNAEIIMPAKPEPYPDFIAPIYSLDLFIPLINLHQATYYLPVSSNLGGILILAYFCLHIAFGWVLMTMFIFGLTGLLKR